jgi:general stress protein CsbA
MNTDIFFAKGETVKEASAHKGLFYPLEIVVFLVIFYASQIVASYLLSVINAARNSGAKNTGYDSSTILIYLYITAVTIGIFVLYAVLVQKRSLRGSRLCREEDQDRERIRMRAADRPLYDRCGRSRRNADRRG